MLEFRTAEPYLCAVIYIYSYSIIELRLAPTYDFIQAVLAMGNEVEVVAPEYVRREIRRRVARYDNS